MYRKGSGAYVKTEGIAGTGTCRTDIGISSKSATEPALPPLVFSSCATQSWIELSTTRHAGGGVTDPATGQQVFVQYSLRA